MNSWTCGIFEGWIPGPACSSREGFLDLWNPRGMDSWTCGIPEGLIPGPVDSSRDGFLNLYNVQYSTVYIRVLRCSAKTYILFFYIHASLFQYVFEFV